MAELETITILRVDTGEAVRSVGDLQDNIKILKASLKDLEIGSEEYQQTLDELKVNQNALRDAMYATSASMEDVAKSATGTSESYNGLVNRMKALKEEFRATEDAARRAELGEQIKAVNDQLKEMDAMQGNFQRNVGNYYGAIKDAMKDVPGFAAPIKKGIDDIDKSMGLLTKNPLLGILTLLFPLIQKITAELKENTTVLDAIGKLTKALEPVFSVVTKTVETLAGWISQAVEWFVKLLDGSKDTFKNIISGAVGVGNAILQYLLTPIRTVVEVAKGLGEILKDVFTGNWKQIKEDATKAFDGIKDAFKRGFDFKDNFAQGKAVGEAWVDGLMSTKPKAKEAGKEVGKAAGAGIAEGIDAMEKEIQDAIERSIQSELKAEEKRNQVAALMEKNNLDRMQKEADTRARFAAAYIDDETEKEETLYQIQLESNQRRLEALRQYQEAALNRGDIDQYLQYQQEAADLSVEIELSAFERRQELRARDEEASQASAQSRIQALMGVANATASVLGSIADMYEQDEKASLESARKAKALRIVEATINTISGAVGAFMSAMNSGIPAPYNMILGAAQAAAATTAGLVQIAKIKAVNVTTSGGGSASAATVSAPRVNVEPQQTTLLQSNSDEQKLNNMMQDQRVYILESDIEAKQGERKVQVQESSF